jgi:hypothetical protein
LSHIIFKGIVYSHELAFCYCSHLLTSQRFSRGHLGSFIAGTKDLRRREEYFRVADLEDVMGSETRPTRGRGKSWLLLKQPCYQRIIGSESIAGQCQTNPLPAALNPDAGKSMPNWSSWLSEEMPMPDWLFSGITAITYNIITWLFSKKHLNGLSCREENRTYFVIEP